MCTLSIYLCIESFLVYSKSPIPLIIVQSLVVCYHICFAAASIDIVVIEVVEVFLVVLVILMLLMVLAGENE